MKYPDMRYVERKSRTTQVKFRGLNSTEGAGDGDIVAMRNMSSDHYPVLATRQKRLKVAQLTAPGGITALEKLAWVDGDQFYYGGEAVGTVEPGLKSFGTMGTTIVILPDKCYYDTQQGIFGQMESKWSGQLLTFTNGLLYGEEAIANTVQCDGVDWAQWFREGDAVTISGCTKHPENNKTPIIRAIDGDKMYFYENIFKLEGSAGQTEYTEAGTLRVERTVPELKYICENEGRLWGCDERTIYATKPNDIFNWNVYDGLESDAWAVTPESPGQNVTCFAYRGFPLFFKEDALNKVYGSYPSNFQLLGSATTGVAEGSGGSLAIAGEVLFYMSRNGIISYTGGIPQNIAEPFGTRQFRNAVGGSDGVKYYVSMEEVGGGWGLYVYDTRSGLWHQEDESRALGFARCAGQLYMLREDGGIWCIGNPLQTEESRTWEPEEDFRWEAEFGDIIEKSPDTKGPNKLLLRLEMDMGARTEVWMRFDSTGDWQLIWAGECEDPKRTYYLPIMPRRADHYRVKLCGVGGCRIHSITREYSKGTAIRSTGRRY